MKILILRERVVSLSVGYMEDSSRQKIAFIGTGVMGASMAGHLLAAGYPVSVYNRTRSKADGLIAAGAVWKDSPYAAAAEADIVITIVGYPSDVEAVYLGEEGIVSAWPKGGCD